MKLPVILLILCFPFFGICQPITINGKIINEEGEPIPSATIILKRTKQPTTSNENGLFTIRNVRLTDILVISAVGYELQTLDPSSIPHPASLFTITLKRNYSKLDEAVIIAYGTTTRRLTTGNVAKLPAKEIEMQAVADPLATLSGRVPGLLITQTSGVPGSSYKAEIRGRSSLDPSIVGNDPLFIIDGVPFAPGNNVVSQLRSAANNPRVASDGGLSPLALINPADIESIEVLKDADATAIYGSRGANGVILITTKKGKAGRTLVTANFYTGFSKITRTASMMNTQQYLQMRNEAFVNDGTVPDVSTAPDLLVWDTTRYTDFKKLFIGGTAHTSDAQVAVSGGTVSTQFLLGAGYHRETTVFPGDFFAARGSFHFNLNHTSLSKKFTAALQALYAEDKNNMSGTDLTTYINLPPDFPSLHDSSGNLKWSEGGVSFTNPLAELLRTYSAKNDNLSANLILSYKLLPALVIKTSVGYNFFQANEISLNPIASVDPQSSSLAFSNFANSSAKSWIAEPQLEFSPTFKKTRFSLLTGATWQHQDNSSTYIDAENYTSDLLISSIAAAPQVYGSNAASLYRYSAFFTRFSINHDNKYLLNLSARRDASSRFGPGHRFGNFGAAGFAWIFSNEKWMQKNLSLLSFGKWRTSYGITGNDQVGDYRFLDSWQNSFLTYQGVSGLQPSRLFNPNYSWEVNRKWETALDLGFLNNKLLFNAAYFIDRSGDRLINYTLPIQTGFSSVLQNWNAVVQNKGLELSLSLENIHIGNVRWSAAFNMTVPENKLVSFPGLAVSSYKNTYVAGHSLSVINLIQFLGVDPATGIYRFRDVDSNNVFNAADYLIQGKTDPSFYGGLSNSVSYKNWQLDFLVEFRRQTGRNYLFTQSSDLPGYWLANQPVTVLDHWQKPGDFASIQRYTTIPGSPAYIAGAVTLPASGAVFSDASFIRFKTLSFSYNLPQAWLSKIKFQTCRLYMQAQNLFTITKYKGADPENQNLYVLPPLRTITAGIQLSL